MDFGAIESATPGGADDGKTAEEAGEVSETGEVSVTFAVDLAKEVLDAAAGVLAGEAASCAAD